MNNEFIKDFILESDWFSAQEIEQAEELAFSKNIDFLDALVELNLLNQESLLRVSAVLMGAPKIDLNEEVVSLEALRSIPAPIIDKYNLIPFRQKGDEVFIAFSEMASLEILEKIFSPEQKFKLFWTDMPEILAVKNKYLKILQEEDVLQIANLSQKILKSADFGFSETAEKNFPDKFVIDIATDIQAEKFLDSLFSYAIKNKADTIFLNPSEDDLRISLRIFNRNYSVLELKKEILTSLSLKFKYWLDVPVKKSELVIQGEIHRQYFNQNYDFFISIIKTDLGDNITIQINRDKKFKTALSLLSPNQAELLLNYQFKDSGFFVLSGEELAKKKSLYAFLEFDVKKNKNIYSLEENINFPLPYVKQIELKQKSKILPLLVKILDTEIDVLALEKISPTILPVIFNFVSTSKKVFFSVSAELESFLNFLLNKNFKYAQIVKNMSLIIDHQKFKNIKEKVEKYYLKKSEIKIIKSFLSEEEIKKLFFYAGHKKESEKKLNKITFYTSSEKKSLFAKKEKDNLLLSSEIIYGVLDLGNFLEEEFIHKHKVEKIKANLKKAVKKSWLENALLASHRQQIDIREVLKKLTS